MCYSDHQDSQPLWRTLSGCIASDGVAGRCRLLRAAEDLNNDNHHQNHSRRGDHQESTWIGAEDDEEESTCYGKSLDRALPFGEEGCKSLGVPGFGPTPPIDRPNRPIAEAACSIRGTADPCYESNDEGKHQECPGRLNQSGEDGVPDLSCRVALGSPQPPRARPRCPADRGRRSRSCSSRLPTDDPLRLRLPAAGTL
jgi:hypothetical protein